MEPGEEAHALPETIPAELEVNQDGQGPCEEPEVADTLPDAPQSPLEMPSAVPVPNEKALPAELRDDVSVASTLSLGSPWEKEIYKYVQQQDGTYVKYIKDECVALAKARGWDLGPIPVGALCKGPGSSDMPPPPVPVKIAAAPTVPNAAPDSPAAPNVPHAAPDSAAAPKVPHADPNSAAAAELPPSVGAPAKDASAPPPPDRTLELAGLEALMTAQKQREQEAVGHEIAKVQQQVMLANQLPVQPADGQTLEISWSTHKKEGMRLKRLMEDSADGQRMYPHMAKMWSGTKEDRV